ncbi:MAG TPA: hypothetical protein VFJ70_07945 [Burkholderiales bacterium]|nr:hypothetical protein [Burkholderiales bacterium]
MEQNLEHLVQHLLASIRAARAGDEPFHHLELSDVFPAGIYGALLDAMPSRADYRPMSGRAKYTRTDDGGTRTKIDLFPELLRRLPPEKKDLWRLVGQALHSAPVREAFRARLAPGLEQRFGPRYRDIGMFPLATLLRDVPGYNIGIHSDTRWKGITVQFYLPRDRSITHVGTVFHRRTGADVYERVHQVEFAPNSGYAFAVGSDSYHSVDTVGPEVRTRDSIILTYYVDDRLVERISNRGKRLANFLRSEWRGLTLRA